MKLVVVLLLALAVAPLHAALVTIEATHEGVAALGDWFVTYSTDVPAPGLNLLSLAFDVSGAGLFFDTDAGGPGHTGKAWPYVEVYRAFHPLAGTATLDHHEFSPGGGSGDGDTQVSLLFSSFAPGDTYAFELDVDQLATMAACGGGFLGGLCRAANTVRDVEAGLVTGNEFAGVVMTASFGGPGWIPATVTGTFESSGWRGIFSANSLSATAVHTPEPGTYLLVGAGLILAGVWRRKRPLGR